MTCDAKYLNKNRMECKGNTHFESIFLLALWRTVVPICTISLNIKKLCILSTEGICMFWGLLLRCYTAYVGSHLSMFQVRQLVTFSRIRQSSKMREEKTHRLSHSISNIIRYRRYKTQNKMHRRPALNITVLLSLGNDAVFSTLKMGVAGSSETLVPIYRTTSLKYMYLSNQCSENLKCSYTHAIHTHNLILKEYQTTGYSTHFNNSTGKQLTMTTTVRYFECSESGYFQIIFHSIINHVIIHTGS